MQKITITIDGPVASGKGITARLVAEQLNYRYLDTGALYRTVALHMLHHNVSASDLDTIVSLLPTMQIEFDTAGHTHLNGTDVSEEIRSEEVSKNSALFSPIPQVRAFLDEVQKQMIQGGGWVMDGRDSGSVVAPQAELKIYLDCDVDIRAQRRALDRGITDPVGIEEIKQEIMVRDEQDRDPGRGKAQLRVLPESIVVDTSNTTIPEQVEIIVNLAQEKINQN